MNSLNIKTIILSLIVIGFLTYLPSIFGGFIWDDEDFVYQNQYVKNFSFGSFFTQDVIAGRGKVSNYYRPIQLILYSSVHAVVGFTPFFYHLLNIVVHIAASSLIFLFFHHLSNRKIPSFLISLLFLIHPVQTEAVSYISGLSDPLYVMFGFLSLLLFLKKDIHPNYLLGSIMAYILCILSKETGLVFLGIITLVALLFNRKNLYFSLFPLYVLSGFYLMFHFSFINKLDTHAVWGSSIYAQSVVVRILTFIQNLYTYIAILLFPRELFMERDASITIQSSLLNPYLIGFIIINILIAAYLWYQRKSEFIKLYILSYGGFFTAFSIYSGVVLINGIFYEHFLYLPMVFFFAFIIYSVKEEVLRTKVAVGLITIIFLLLVIRSYYRQYEWIDPVRFYTQTLKHDPKSIRIRNNLGMAYMDKKELKKGIQELEAATKIDPSVPNLYHNMGNAYTELGDYKKAEMNYLKAIEVSPTFHFSYIALINLYQNQKEKEKLRKIMEKYDILFKIR